MKASRLAGFLLLCLLSGSGWLLTLFYPSAIAAPFSTCIHFAMIGLIAALVWLRSRNPRVASELLFAIALAGAALFALPAVVLQITAGAVPEFFSVAMFCAISVMTVLLLGIFSGDAGGMSPRGLIASLVGLGGALRLFPVALPASSRGWRCGILVACSCLVIALASVWMHRLVRGVATAAVVAVASLGSAVALGVYAAFLGWPVIGLHAVAVESFRCGVFDLPVVWLTMWLIREMDPKRMAARFLLAPLVTAVGGYAAMRGGVDLNACVAMALMAAGGVMLLLAGKTEEVTSLHLH